MWEGKRFRCGDLLLQTTFPPVVTIPSSATLTSITVPFVKTPREVYKGDWGFFLTPRIGNWNVAFNSADSNELHLQPMGWKAHDVCSVSCSFSVP
jgi:hypothetical protein